MEKKIYLYLEKKEWANTWVNGGTIPINLASNYKKNYRDGIYTPDENFVRNLKNLDEDRFKRIANINEPGVAEGKSTISIKIGNYIENGVPAGKDIQFDAKFEEGYILSFSNTLGNAQMKKFKKKVCVEITDITKLKNEISTQINLEGIIKNCQYTDGKNRNHFLKSTKDEWQDELRIFWKTNAINPSKSINVKISRGIGKIVELK